MRAIDDQIEERKKDNGDEDGIDARSVEPQTPDEDRRVASGHVDRPGLEIAPHPQRQRSQQHEHAERGEHLVGERAVAQKAKHAVFEQDTKQAHCDHGGDEADQIRRAKRRGHDVGRVAAEHDLLPVRKVDHAIDAEEQSEPRGRHRQIHPVRDAVDDLLNERGEDSQRLIRPSAANSAHPCPWCSATSALRQRSGDAFLSEGAAEVLRFLVQRLHVSHRLELYDLGSLLPYTQGP